MNKNLNDTLNYVSKLNLQRLWNGFKVYFSYRYSRITGNVWHWGDPISMSIEPTTSCNLRCPQCPSGLRSFSRPTGMLQGDLFQKLIDEQKNTLTYLTLYFQGEPYLNPDFLDMVAYASKNKIYTATSTNAHYFNPENAKRTVDSGLDRVIISIDGVEQDSYGKYRIGGKLDKVLDGTRELVKAKKAANSSTPHIIWQFIVFKHNEGEVEAIKSLAKEYEVDELGIKTAQIYDYENGNDLLPDEEEYRRYTIAEQSFVIKNKLLNHCWRMWHGCVVTWDGKVAPCCFDKDASYRLGDLQTHDFKDIWNNEEYTRFRKLILKSRSNIDICRNCSEGTQIWS